MLKLATVFATPKTNTGNATEPDEKRFISYFLFVNVN